jgi:hypothetical protein
MPTGKTIAKPAPDFRYGSTCHLNGSQIVGYREVPAVRAHIELFLSGGRTQALMDNGAQKDFVRQRSDLDKWLASNEGRQIATNDTAAPMTRTAGGGGATD